MQKFAIKTWGCSCGYYQDFEPLPELMLKVHGFASDRCPSCKLHTLAIQTPKIFMNVRETGEIATLRTALEGEATLTVKPVGEKIARAETAQEKTDRINKKLEGLGEMTAQQITDLKTLYEAK